MMGFSGCSDGEESSCNVGDPGSVSGSGRSPGKGNDTTWAWFLFQDITTSFLTIVSDILLNALSNACLALEVNKLLLVFIFHDFNVRKF